MLIIFNTHCITCRIEYLSQWKFQGHISIIKQGPFSIIRGLNLPVPLAGHCQLNLGNEKLFIYGGLTAIDTVTINGRLHYPYNYSNIAWTYENKKWMQIPLESPCPKMSLDQMTFQQCSLKGHSDIITLSHDYELETTCTSVLNIKALTWIKVESMSMKLGGFLMNGFDSSRLFYFGGLRTNRNMSHELSIQEFDNYGWKTLESMILPFPIDQFNFKVLKSDLNITMCRADKDAWPIA